MGFGGFEGFGVFWSVVWGFVVGWLGFFWAKYSFEIACLALELQERPGHKAPHYSQILECS